MLSLPLVEREHGLKSVVAQDGTIVSRPTTTRCTGDFTPGHPRTLGQGSGR